MSPRYELLLRAIGVIHTPHRDLQTTPIQPVFASGARGRVEVFPEFAEGLGDLEGFSHVYPVYAFHLAGPPRLRVKPFLHDVEHGVFSTRFPGRPNPIGISLVRLISLEEDLLHVEDVDMLDGTPLIDIKPYVPRFDVREGARAGWHEKAEKRKGVEP
jgi:tRNA-Thr(GGU) m(6)t(6)A37 methyltransferase TsaA